MTTKPTPLEREDRDTIAQKIRDIVVARNGYLRTAVENNLASDMANEIDLAIADYVLDLVSTKERKASIEENESIRHMLAETIELGRDYCYNHEKYVGQCYACQTAKWTKIIAKMYMNSIKERLATLNAKEKDV